MFHLQDGAYYAGGVRLLDLHEEYDTPLYVYDGNYIQDQFKRLQQAFAPLKHKIKYACKANTNLNILRLLKQAGSGLDTVSIQEVWLGLRAGFAPEDILYTPNGVSFEEIQLAVKEGVAINIDNHVVLEQFGCVYGSSVPVCIRINPHVLAGGNTKIQTGHIDSKFGISIFQMRHVQRIVEAYDIQVEGIHMHTGSEIVNLDVFMQAADVLLDVAMDFKDLRYIDFGSGFKVPYKLDDNATDVEELGQRLAERMERFAENYGRALEVWFEPGKFLVSSAGYLLVKTNVVKQTVSTVFAGVDSGMNHLLRPMLYDAYHPIYNVSNPTGQERVYSVVGYICETDTFAWDRKLQEVRTGDILAIGNAGAYGFMMASNYNSRFRPAEVLLLNGKHHLIRRRECLDDLLKTTIELPELKAEPTPESA